MPATWQIMVYQNGSDPVPSEVMVTKMPKTAVTRMREIRAEHPQATFRLGGSSAVSEDEASALHRMAEAAGLVLGHDQDA